MHWYLTRSTDISQDLLRSHKIYWYGKIHLTFDIRTFTFYIWHLKFETSFHIWHLLRSQKIYWDLKISTDLASYIWHLTFGIWHLTFHDIWHLTFDIWHLTWLKVLTALALVLLILAQFYQISTDGFWGYLQSKKIMTYRVNNIGLRDASASKNLLNLEFGIIYVTFCF